MSFKTNHLVENGNIIFFSEYGKFHLAKIVAAKKTKSIVRLIKDGKYGKLRCISNRRMRQVSPQLPR